MKLHHEEVDSDDKDTLIKYSDLFHISMDELNRIIENAWSPIGEMFSNIKIEDQSFFHSIQNQFDIRMLYQAKEKNFTFSMMMIHIFQQLNELRCYFVSLKRYS